MGYFLLRLKRSFHSVSALAPLVSPSDFPSADVPSADFPAANFTSDRAGLCPCHQLVAETAEVGASEGVQICKNDHFCTILSGGRAKPLFEGQTFAVVHDAARFSFANGLQSFANALTVVCK